MTIRTAPVLGIDIACTDIEGVLTALSALRAASVPAYVCAADVNSLVTATEQRSHLEALQGAAIVLPDGAPVAFMAGVAAKLRVARVPGPDLFARALEDREQNSWKHYFYGGSPETLLALEREIRGRFPNSTLVGFRSPPFGEQSDDQLEADLELIQSSGADIVWIGLGCPKQERWMRANCHKLPGTVTIGVGAAFDFVAGTVPRAPIWMRRLGLEWLFRLGSQPRRLWRRYLLRAPKFCMLALLGLKVHRA